MDDTPDPRPIPGTRADELERQNRALVARQAASIEVLKAISASPDDPQPVFELIARAARELCDAATVSMSEYDGALQHIRVMEGFDPAATERIRQAYPRPPDPDSMHGRAVLAGHTIHIRDLSADTTFFQLGQDLGVRSRLTVPLLRDGRAIGVLSLGRLEPGGFDASEVALVESFAEQASLAISGAATLRELRARTAELAQRNSEYGERIEQQSATIDVLKEMSASPSDPRPVFESIAARARTFCDADVAGVVLLNGEKLHLAAKAGWSGDQAEAYEATFPTPVTSATIYGRAVLARDAVEISNTQADPEWSESMRAVVDAKAGSCAAVPMLRGTLPIGSIGIGRYSVGSFTRPQMELLRTFAEQAVIAISSAETYRALQERTEALARRNDEFGERIEQQAATIDVLKVMSGSPDDTQPVFDQIVRRATELCNGVAASLFQFDGELVHFSAGFWKDRDSDAPVTAAWIASFPRVPGRDSITCRAILDKQMNHVRDTTADRELSPVVRAQLRGLGSQVSIPLIRDCQAIGAITLNAIDPGGFTDSQVALLQTFAEQAVIAITSVANFRALRERTAELTRSVAELQALEEVLRAVNSSLDLDTVLATIVNRAVRLSRADEGLIYEFDETEQVFVPKSAYGMTEDRIAGLRDRRIRLGETWLGRSAVERAPVYVEDVQQDPAIRDTGGLLAGIHAVLAVPLLREDKVIGGMVIRRRVEGGFAPTTVTLMQTFAAQCVLAIENARLFQELAARGEEARRARLAAETALTDLRRTQDRLVQTEKLASLGQLTAGIAHEIKNPLNFVNNFAELSVDLLDELHDAVAPDKLTVAADLRAEIDDITATLKGNLEKIAQHGKRADSIVKNMLLHSRSGPSEHRPIDLNATVEEALNLAYHGARAETPGFNITLEKHFDLNAGSVDAFPQEFIRVMLNLIGNGFYAARKRAGIAPPGFEPTLTITTRDLGEQVEISVRDNGTGIPAAVREKIFEPFFTTKPAGEGTGLGLSLSYDIIVKQHNGQLTVDSTVDEFTEFRIVLPRRMTGGRA